MRNWFIFTLLTLMSVSTLAGHHGDGHKKGGLFKQADLNQDGAISADEHEAAIQKMADLRRQRFSAMDADGDGAVSREEAKALRAERHKKREAKKAAQ